MNGPPLEILFWIYIYKVLITVYFQEQVWKFNENGLLPNYPQLTVSEFQGMPSIKVDASLAFKNGWTFLFTGLFFETRGLSFSKSSRNYTCDRMNPALYCRCILFLF